MLFWLFVIMVVVGFVAYAVVHHYRGYKYQDAGGFKEFCYYNEDGLKITSGIIAGLGIFGVVISLIFIGCYYFTASGYQASDQERYKALSYKLESGACRDEFGLLNKSVIDEIQEWNESVARNKRMQRDFWLGIYIPNIYDNFETIDYDKFVRSPGMIDIPDEIKE